MYIITAVLSTGGILFTLGLLIRTYREHKSGISSIDQHKDKLRLYEHENLLSKKVMELYSWDYKTTGEKMRVEAFGQAKLNCFSLLPMTKLTGADFDIME